MGRVTRMIYDAIIRHIDEKGFPPTTRELKVICKLSSTSVADYHLKNLSNLGLIRRTPGIARGIEVVDDGPKYQPYQALIDAAHAAVLDPRNMGATIDRLAVALANIGEGVET